MYNWSKGIVQWTIKDTLYLSVVFSWDLPKAHRIAEASKKKVIIGGPAAKLNGIESDPLPYPPLSFHNPLATFTTRGCVNHCEFCGVPDLEGELRELPSWDPRPVICDNNLLAASRKHFDKVIDSLKSMPFVDFNQGLEASRITIYHALRMAELKAVKVRFAFDSISEETSVMDAIKTAQEVGIKDIGCYCLIGFKDTPEDANYRLELIRSTGALPNPMRYQPLKCQHKDEFVEKGWTEKQLQDMMRYYSKLNYLGHIPFKEYHHGNYTENGVLPL
jgi:hypothetical protein